MKTSAVIPIQSCCVITTIVYALLVPVFFEMDNTFGDENFVDDDNTIDSQQIEVTETDECKSPCPSTAEMCIELCA